MTVKWRRRIERVKNQIENQTNVYSIKGNRGRKELVLNEGDWV